MSQYLQQNSILIVEDDQYLLKELKINFTYKETQVHSATSITDDILNRLDPDILNSLVAQHGHKFLETIKGKALNEEQKGHMARYRDKLEKFKGEFLAELKKWDPGLYKRLDAGIPPTELVPKADNPDPEFYKDFGHNVSLSDAAESFKIKKPQSGFGPGSQSTSPAQGEAQAASPTFGVPSP